MAPRTKETPGFFDHMAEAINNGISYSAYYRRVMKDGLSPKEAATIKRMPCRRGPTEGSISESCRRAGVSRGLYYSVKEELEEEGIQDLSVQDVLDIAIKRKQK